MAMTKEDFLVALEDDGLLKSESQEMKRLRAENRRLNARIHGLEAKVKEREGHILELAQFIKANGYPEAIGAFGRPARLGRQKEASNEN